MPRCSATSRARSATAARAELLFKFNVPAAECVVNLTMTHTTANGDITLRLLDVLGDLVASNPNSEDTEQISTTVSSDGDYIAQLELSSTATENWYHLNVDVVCP